MISPDIVNGLRSYAAAFEAIQEESSRTGEAWDAVAYKYGFDIARAMHLLNRTYVELMPHLLSVETLKLKLQCALDFMTGEWQPEDVDRHRYVESLKEILNVHDEG